MSDVLQNHQQLQERAAVAIRKLAGIASQRGAKVTLKDRVLSRSDILLSAADRLQNNQFTLAVVGEFSRGKSTLINALLQAPDLLPTSIKPATAAITVLQYSTDPHASVLFKDGSEREDVSLSALNEYCLGSGLDGSAMRNKITGAVSRMRQQNQVESLQEIEEQARELAPRPAVHLVNVWYPSPLLADGITLVDTPGIGSVNPEHGEATRSFIHKADAVIFLINTDPVISASECNFLSFLQDYVSRFLFVITKIDRYEEAERRESMEYTREIVQEFTGMKEPPLFPVSAKRYMDALSAGDNQAAQASGVPAFLQALQLFLIRERGHAFIREHVTTALTHLSDLRTAVQMELQGTQLSQADLRQRLEATQPGVSMARAARDRILATLDQSLQSVPEMVGGEADMLWIRLLAALRQSIDAEVDRYGWDELRQASELLPIFVRDALTAALNERLDVIAERLNRLRRGVLRECRQVMDTMASKIEFNVQNLRPPRELEMHLDFDPSVFVADLKKVGTITVGSTLALSIGTTFLFGGLGALVVVGGLVAGTGVTSLLKTRVKNELRQALDEPLTTLLESVRANLVEEVQRHLSEFRDDVEQALTGAISNVDDTLRQLETQALHEDTSRQAKEQELQEQLAVLNDLDRELSFLLGPGI